MGAAAPLGWLLWRWSLVELDGDVGGDFRGAAAPLWWRPGVWMEELTTVVAAVGHPGAVQSGMRPVQLLLSITLHEEVDGHHSCTLGNIDTSKKKQWLLQFYVCPSQVKVL